MLVRTSTVPALVAGALLVGCGDDDDTIRLRAFTECVIDAGGAVDDDAYLATDETGRPLAVVGDVDASDALIRECLDAASD